MFKVACLAAIFAVGASRPQDSIAGFRRLGGIDGPDDFGELDELGEPRFHSNLGEFDELGDLSNLSILGKLGKQGKFGSLSDHGNRGHDTRYSGLSDHGNRGHDTRYSGLSDHGNRGHDSRHIGLSDHGNRGHDSGLSGLRDYGNRGHDSGLSGLRDHGKTGQGKHGGYNNPGKFGNGAKPSGHTHSDTSYQFPYSTQSIKLNTDDEDDDHEHQHHTSNEQHNPLEDYHPSEQFEEYGGHHREAQKFHENSMESPMQYKQSLGVSKLHHDKHHKEMPKKHEKHDKHHHKSEFNTKYEYDYSVQDPHTGDYKTHHEARTGDMVHGFYTIHEADGTTRIVEYSADPHDGFKANVRHEGQVTHAA